MEVVVRGARREDVDDVATLVRRFSREDGFDSPLTAADLVALAFDQSPWVRIMVAERAGDLLGYVLYYPSFDTDHAACGFYLQDVYVRHDARRRGIGRALMAATSRRCLDEGGRYLFWNAHVGNRAGRAFYRAIGAVEEPVVTLSLQPGPLRALAEQDTPSPNREAGRSA